MKKLNIIFALIISSFFLLSSNVSAEVINLDVNSTDLDYINERLTTIKELATILSQENNKDFIIYYDLNWNVIFFDENYINLDNNNSKAYLTFLNYERYIHYKSSQKLNSNDSGNKLSSLLISNIFSDNPTLNYKMYLYNSSNTSKSTILGYDFNINYNNEFFLIKENTHFPSLYELYLGYEPPEQENHKDPKSEILTNFYVLIIDKIKLLTNYIATDYIILSALVIFIFVAVIGLVRRLK